MTKRLSLTAFVATILFVPLGASAQVTVTVTPPSRPRVVVTPPSPRVVIQPPAPRVVRVVTPAQPPPRVVQVQPAPAAGYTWVPGY
jgi:hypothetical protein